MFLGLCLAAGCKSAAPVPAAVDPLFDAQRPWTSSLARPRVALVLSGGAARGFAQIGAIRVLEAEQVPIDFVVGTSAGSLIGALYGGSKNSFELEKLASDLKQEDIFDFTLLTPTQGYVRGERLPQFLRAKIGAVNLESLRFPLYVTATDLQTGERVVFSSGPADLAVRASASIPVLFPPLKMDGRQFVDGGVVDNVPVDVARERGADIVIAVDVSKTVVNRNLDSVKDYALQAISILMAQNSQTRLKNADVIVRPETGQVTMWDFSRKKELVESGVKAMQQGLPKLREAYRKWIEAHAAAAPAAVN